MHMPILRSQRTWFIELPVMLNIIREIDERIMSPLKKEKGVYRFDVFFGNFEAHYTDAVKREVQPFLVEEGGYRPHLMMKTIWHDVHSNMLAKISARSFIR